MGDATLGDYLFPILGGIAGAVSPALGRGVAIGSGIAYGVQKNKAAAAARERAAQQSQGIQQWVGQHQQEAMGNPQMSTMLDAIRLAAGNPAQAAAYMTQYAGLMKPPTPPPDPAVVQQSMVAFAPIAREIQGMLPQGADLSFNAGGFSLHVRGAPPPKPGKAPPPTREEAEAQAVQVGAFMDSFMKKYSDLQITARTGDKLSFTVSKRRMPSLPSITAPTAGRPDIRETLEKESIKAMKSYFLLRDKAAKLKEAVSFDLPANASRDEVAARKRDIEMLQRINEYLGELQRFTDNNLVMLYGTEPDGEAQSQPKYDADPEADVNASAVAATEAAATETAASITPPQMGFNPLVGKDLIFDANGNLVTPGGAYSERPNASIHR